MSLATIIPTGALDAWQRLGLALQDVVPPCSAEPDEWADPKDRDAVAAAQDGCMDCPAMLECADYAEAADEQYGVWGGVDRTPYSRKQPRRRSA